MNFLQIIAAFLPALSAGGNIATGLWPAIAPIISALSGVNPSNKPNTVALVQEALNALQASGVVNFGAPLVVDGNFGGRTFAAIKVAQAQFGLAVQEPMASAEMNMLAALFKAIG